MERLKNGIITENPVFIMALGLCPAFAVTTNAVNALEWAFRLSQF